MKLSEAIRLGAMLGPQAHICMIGEDNASCALGAAALALGFNYEKARHDDESPYRFINARFPVLSKPNSINLKFLIWEKNDTDGWSREEIADWIVANGYDCESVEPASPQPQPSEEGVPVCV